MSLFNSFDRNRNLGELTEPYLSQGSGVVSAATRQLAALRNVVGDQTLTKAQFVAVSGVTPGTVTASKAVVVDANKDVSSFRNVTATTLIGNIRITVNPDVAGAGTVLADAAQLLEGFQVITGANGTVGWKLPATPTAGTIVWIKGTTAGVAKIWPDAAATINAIASNGAISLTTGAMPAIFIAKSATQWYTFPLVAS